MPTIKGTKLTEEHRMKISNDLKGKTSFRKGKMISEEHKRKISKSLKGYAKTQSHIKNHADSLRGRKEPKEITQRRIQARKNNGREWHSEKTKSKMSKVKKGKYIGKNSSGWKGGLSFEPYSYEFNEQLKNMVRERTGCICQVCGNLGFVVHHIDYDKKNNKFNNLITICCKCHGKTNFDRQKWSDYFRNLEAIKK